MAIKDFVSFVFFPLICFIFATTIIFGFLLNADGVAVDELSRNEEHVLYEAIPSYVNDMDNELIIVRHRYLSKMAYLAGRQVVNECPRRLLVFTSCPKTTCEDLGSRLIGLVASFITAYATDRLFVVSWKKPYNLAEYFDVNANFYDGFISYDLIKTLVSKTDEETFYFESDHWPTEDQWSEIEALSFTNHSVAVLQHFLSDPKNAKVIEELFLVDEKTAEKRWLIEPNLGNIVAVALRIIFDKPSVVIRNVIADIWKDMFDLVDPPRGRQLLPGRMVGNDGITRIGVFASFNNSAVLNANERLDLTCLVEGVVNLATYHGMINGVAGVFVASDSEEARHLLVEAIGHRGLPALSIDTEQMVRALGIKQAMEWSSVNDIRALLEFLLLSRMDLLIFRQNMLGDVVALTAGNSPRLPIYFLPMERPAFDKNRDNFDDYCYLRPFH